VSARSLVTGDHATVRPVRASGIVTHPLAVAQTATTRAPIPTLLLSRLATVRAVLPFARRWDHRAHRTRKPRRRLGVVGTERDTVVEVRSVEVGPFDVASAGHVA